MEQDIVSKNITTKLAGYVEMPTQNKYI